MREVQPLSYQLAATGRKSAFDRWHCLAWMVVVMMVIVAEWKSHCSTSIGSIQMEVVLVFSVCSVCFGLALVECTKSVPVCVLMSLAVPLRCGHLGHGRL